ncbi:MAG: hypothetical protein MO852_17620 [Candidatus Devosia euplotis]|nr:hypothetical protein [Candidatus Devosia euplotis]
MIVLFGVLLTLWRVVVVIVPADQAVLEPNLLDQHHHNIVPGRIGPSHAADHGQGILVQHFLGIEAVMGDIDDLPHGNGHIGADRHFERVFEHPAVRQRGRPDSRQIASWFP